VNQENIRTCDDATKKSDDHHNAMRVGLRNRSRAILHIRLQSDVTKFSEGSSRKLHETLRNKIHMQPTNLREGIATLWKKFFVVMFDACERIDGRLNDFIRLAMAQHPEMWFFPE